MFYEEKMLTPEKLWLFESKCGMIKFLKSLFHILQKTEGISPSTVKICLHIKNTLYVFAVCAICTCMHVFLSAAYVPAHAGKNTHAVG